MGVPSNHLQVLQHLAKGEKFDHHSMLSGSWRVVYNDGTELSQYNDGKEVPYKNIEWCKVERLILESQYVTHTFKISVADKDLRFRLQSRHWLSTTGHRIMAFMLVAWSKEDEKPTDDNTAWVVYWIPNGLIHHCHKFNCPDVADYCSKRIHQSDASLGLEHEFSTGESAESIFIKE